MLNPSILQEPVPAALRSVGEGVDGVSGGSATAACENC